MVLEKPKAITITIGDRKEKKFTSFVVYGMNIEEVEKKIKNVLKK
jgi:hypothetical protein